MDTNVQPGTLPLTLRQGHGQNVDAAHTNPTATQPTGRMLRPLIRTYMYVIRLPKVVAVRRLTLTFTNPPLFLWRSAQHPALTHTVRAGHAVPHMSG